jgi:hypothetical protein
MSSSGRVVTTGYDSANRPYSVSGLYTGVGSPYVNEVSYASYGGPEDIGFGNNVHHDLSYNSRMQVNQIWDTVGNNPNYWMLYLGLTYGTASKQ